MFTIRRCRLPQTLLIVLGCAALLPRFLHGQGKSAGDKQPPVGESWTVQDANELTCGVDASGIGCMGFGHNGGWWPADTRNGHFYGTGIEVIGIIPRAELCGNPMASNIPSCFPWSGDTTGAVFFSGYDNHHGTPLTGIFNSGDPKDRAQWPRRGQVKGFDFLDAHIDDTSVFAPELMGRMAASEQDTWTAYWDGEPSRNRLRTHPAGILVEQRTLAWNHPRGNEATIYQVFRITNVTHLKEFQQRSEAAYFEGRNALPDAGWTLDSIHIAFLADMDVGVATSNLMTALLPLDLMLAYHAGFFDPNYQYPARHFRPPFLGGAPGFAGAAFLKSPIDSVTEEAQGLVRFSTYTSGGAFPAPNSVAQAWRYLAGRRDTAQGDGPCVYDSLGICFQFFIPVDVRGFMSTGPFSLGPGESETIVVGIMAAAAVATPLITAGPAAGNTPPVPARAPGCDRELHGIEIAAGWVATTTCPEEGAEVVGDAITVVPQSLLHRVLVARDVVANRFRLADAPAAPVFALVPGDGQISVVWDPSTSETTGDALRDLATDTTSRLYDPNYRTLDVEGYRIYRGTRPDRLELLAQFDFDDTFFRDVLCVTDPTHITDTPCTSPGDVPILGELVQHTIVSALPNGNPVILAADSATAARQAAGTAHALANFGVPYAFVDTDVVNGYAYYYRVTAFDINSAYSAPGSLESMGTTKAAIARTQPGTRAANVEVGLFGRGVLLDTTSVTLDPATGTFSGPQPPSDLFTAEFSSFAAQLLESGSRLITIDSVVPGYYVNGLVARYYLSVDGTPHALTFDQCNVQTGSCGPRQSERVGPELLESDPGLREAAMARGVDAPRYAASLGATLATDRQVWASGMADWAGKQTAFWAPSSVDPPAAIYAGGSRWFSGSNETMPDPTLGVASYGELPGMVIFQPQPYRTLAIPDTEAADGSTVLQPYTGTTGATLSGDLFRRFHGSTLGVMRAADMRFHWGASRLDSVIDVTHNVPVPFHALTRASYGFLQDADENGVLNYGDFYYNAGLITSPPSETSVLAEARPTPFAAQPVVLPVDVTGDLLGDGSGFGLYIAGEPYLFRGSVPSNTTWTLRTYHGAVTRTDGTYEFKATPRNPAVPGLSVGIRVNQAEQVSAADVDLSRVHTIPDPYYARSRLDAGTPPRELQFVNLPPQATLRIYSLSGVLVDMITHEDPTGGGRATWDLRNRDGRSVASGVYFFHIAVPDGREHVGRFTVVLGK